MWSKSKPSEKKQTTTLYRWYQSLDQPVPLDMVAPLLKTDSAAVAKHVKAGDLEVHKFKAKTGKTFRVVKFDDIQKLKEKQKQAEKLQRSMLTVFKQWANS